MVDPHLTPFLPPEGARASLGGGPSEGTVHPHVTPFLPPRGAHAPVRAARREA